VAGVKVTVIEQLAPATTELPQLLVWPKLLALVPVIVIPLIVSAALPVLVSVMGCDALPAPLNCVNESELTLNCGVAVGVDGLEELLLTLPPHPICNANNPDTKTLTASLLNRQKFMSESSPEFQ